MKKLLFLIFAAAFSLGATATTYTSASYAQREHLLIHWDGIDNAGTGTHNPGATTWKNIAPNATAYDLTLTGNGAWSGYKALSVNGTSATYDAGDKAHYDERFTLIECGSDSTAALQTLASKLNENLGCNCTAVEGGTRLVYIVPPRPGLVIVFQ